MKDYLFDQLKSGLSARVSVSIGLVVGTWAMQRLLLRIASKRIKKRKDLYIWRKGISYCLFIFCFILVGRIWFTGLDSLATFLGLVSAGVAISLRDLLSAVAAWVYLVWKRPFQVGDRIEIGEIKGDVIDIEVLQFSLLEVGNWIGNDQSTGRIVHVPNALLFQKSLFNFTKGFEYIWNEIQVVFTFESDWKVAKLILEKAVEKYHKSLDLERLDREIRKAGKALMLTYTKLSPIVYIGVLDHGVGLTMRYLCPPRQRRSSEHDIWSDVLVDVASEKSIEFAYPTTRFYAEAQSVKTPTKKRGKT
ncbi:MAG: small-conductance mechanosensitive channel [Candidatus Marinamargulisbacteria bacterium]|jgi:small-conductance mechanosensitive channel